MPRLLERINFPKVISVLAATFGIALGSCGLSAVMFGYAGGNYDSGLGRFIVTLGYLELVAMILSAFGLVVMAILWVVASLLGQTKPRDPEIQTLFGDRPHRDSEKNDNH